MPYCHSVNRDPCYLGNALEVESHVEDDVFVLDVYGIRYLVTWPTCDQCGAQFQRADGGLADESGRYRFCDEDCRAEWRHNH